MANADLNIQLSPELLLQQSQEMISLKTEYESLFQNTLSDLQGVNSSWSEFLSNNFTAKIQSAQKSFSGVETMLQNGAYAASLAANGLTTVDSELSKMISSAGGFLSDVGEMIKSDYKNLNGYLDKIGEVFERGESQLSSSQKAWLKLVFGKLTPDGMKDVVASGQIADYLREGEYEKAFDKLFTTIGKATDYKGLEVKYGLNLIKNAFSSGYEFAEEGFTWENAGEMCWNVTAKPVLDTVEDAAHKFVSLVPGTSEYYAEKGAEDGHDMAVIALGDYYSMLTGDEGYKDHVNELYKDGYWDGFVKTGHEMESFVRDSGGFGNAAKNFFKTAYKDGTEALNNTSENILILGKQAVDYVKDVGSFVVESGGFDEAGRRFVKTAVKDTVNGVAETVENVWHAVWNTDK